MWLFEADSVLSTNRAALSGHPLVDEGLDQVVRFGVILLGGHIQVEIRVTNMAIPNTTQAFITESFAHVIDEIIENVFV